MSGDFGFPGDVSVSGQNRLRETYMGCAPCAAAARGGLSSAVQSGQYMGAIGKVISMGGLRGFNPPMNRAQQELARFGIAQSPSVRAAVGLRGLGLGDGVRDRAMCQGSFAAGQAGVGAGTQYHTQSGGTDQGWSTALGISSALMTVGGAMCNFIDTGAPTSPTGQPYVPSTLYSQPPPPTPAQPNWLLIGGVAAGALVAGYLIFGK